MRKISEVLRLKCEQGRSNREIGISCGIGSSTVSEYILRVRRAGLRWPLPEHLGESALEQLLFPAPPPQCCVSRWPDYPSIHRELQSRKSVTLYLLWQENRELAELDIQIDHVHLLVLVSPKVSISNFVGTLKGRTAVRGALAIKG